MEEAVSIIFQAALNNYPTVIVQDCDVDGYTSTSILFNFLFKVHPHFAENHITILQHEGKQHGLFDLMDKIPEDTLLVVLPDAGTNDVEQCKALRAKGTEVVVLDHHESDTDNPYAVIVNPQIGGRYPNKNLVGAGVTWQFCRAYSEVCGYGDVAWDYIDLCALGQIGDMSDYRDLEVRAMVNLGLSNIKNKFIDAIVSKNTYSFNKMNGVNYYSMAFYCVPFINAICRSGTAEEKKLVLHALLEKTQQEEVESSKRGEKGKSIPCFQEAVTVIERVKRRQTKAQDEAMDYFENQIVDNDLTQNAMIFLIDKESVVPAEIRGLIANKIQAKYQHPTAVLSLSDNMYAGSMRNYGLSVNQDLKATLESTELAQCIGHKNAAGLFVKSMNLSKLNKAMNDIYKDIDQTPTYHIDYLWNWDTIDAKKTLEIGCLTIYGQNIPESLICVENVPLKKCAITLMGVEKGHPTLKININGVDVIKFKSSQEEYEEFSNPNACLTLIGKCKKNEWQGNVSPQILIEDFELTTQETDWTEDWVF